eukprot:5622557-Pleurochrysis_carterae.AAC.1
MANQEAMPRSPSCLSTRDTLHGGLCPLPRFRRSVLTFALALPAFALALHVIFVSSERSVLTSLTLWTVTKPHRPLPRAPAPAQRGHTCAHVCACACPHATAARA